MCPKCGYCPTCGRSNDGGLGAAVPVQPSIPPQGPMWINPNTTLTGVAPSNLPNGTIAPGGWVYVSNGSYTTPGGTS